MKKRIFWSFLVMMSLILLSVGFVSCGDDDDSSSNVIVGKWDGDHSEDSWIDYTFRKDGTGEKVIRYDGGSSWYRNFTYRITSQYTSQDENYGNVIRGTIHVKYTRDNTEEDWSFRLELNKYLIIDGYQSVKQ